MNATAAVFNHSVLAARAQFETGVREATDEGGEVTFDMAEFREGPVSFYRAEFGEGSTVGVRLYCRHRSKKQWLTPRTIAGLGATVGWYILTMFGAAIVVTIIGSDNHRDIHRAADLNARLQEPTQPRCRS